MALNVNLEEVRIFNLIRNIDDKPPGQIRQEAINNIDTLIQALIPDYNTITENSEFKNWNSYFQDRELYTPEFINIIQQIYTIIVTYDDDENVKYTNIGKAFFNLSCNNNNYGIRFVKHIINLNKVKAWNKKILKLKLKQTIISVINLIGDCDYNMLSRNLASDVKLKTGMVLNTFLEPEKESEYTYNAVKLEAVNLVRSQIILLKSYFDQDIVTSKELETNVKMNKPYWLENPAIIASMTAVTNTFLSLSTFQAKLSETPFVNNVASSINSSFIPTLLHSLPITAVVVTGMLTGFLVPVASLGMLALGTYIYNKISNNDYVKIKNRNKELNIKTIEITDYYKKQNLIITNTCGLSADAPKYYKKFEQALELENNYITESAQNYDLIVTLSYNFVNIYSIICQDVFQPPPITQNPVAQNPVGQPIVEGQNQVGQPIVEGQNQVAQNQVAQNQVGQNQVAQNQVAQNQVAVPNQVAVQNQGQAEALEAQRTNILGNLEQLWDKTQSGQKKGNITPVEYENITTLIRPFIKAKLNLRGDCTNNSINQKNIKAILNDFRNNTSYDTCKGDLCGRKAVGGKTKRPRKGKKTQNKRSIKGKKTHKRR